MYVTDGTHFQSDVYRNIDFIDDCQPFGRVFKNQIKLLKYGSLATFHYLLKLNYNLGNTPLVLNVNCRFKKSTEILLL